MDVNLTKGAIMTMCNTTCEELQPVLQVIDLKLVESQQNSTTERYRLVLSDGLFYQQGMLATQKNYLIHEGRLQKGSIVKLLQYICNDVQGCKIIIIMELDVILDKYDLIGQPSPAPKEPPAQYATGQPGNTYGPNEGTSIPPTTQNQVGLANPSTPTPSATVVVPTTGLVVADPAAVVVPTTGPVVADPVAALREFMLSFSSSQSQVERNPPPTAPSYNVVPFFEELKSILHQHGCNIFEVLSKLPEVKQRIFDLVKLISEHQEHLAIQQRHQFQELAPLLTRILKSQTDLEGKGVTADVLEYEVYQLDEENFKTLQRLETVNETLRDGEDQILELNAQATTFENSIAHLNKEIQRLTLQHKEVTTRAYHIQNMISPILEVKDQVSSKLEDIKRHREDLATRKVGLATEKLMLERGQKIMQEELLKFV